MISRETQTLPSLSILDSFHEKCESNGLWYSLSGISLLNSKSKKKYSQNNLIEVMMPLEDYYKFNNLYKNNIYDSLIDNNYFFMCPFYFEEDNEVKIKINILIPADTKKTEKFYTRKNYLRQQIGYYKSLKNFPNFSFKFKRIFYKTLGLFMSPLTWQEISSNIFSEKYNGYFIVNSFKPNINENWLPSLTIKREEIKWFETKTKILKEWNVFLIKKYGFDWENKPDFVKESIYFNWKEKE